jgi:hypothetical protein
MRRKESIN